MKKSFKVACMTCSSCAIHVERAVRNLPSVESAAVDLVSNVLVVTTVGDKEIDEDGVSRAVHNAGYQVVSSNVDTSERTGSSNTIIGAVDREASKMRKRLLVSFGFSIPLVYLAMGHMLGIPIPAVFTAHGNEFIFAFTQLLLVLPVVLVNGVVFSAGFKTLVRRKPVMDSLIAIGSSAALLYGIYALYQIGWGLGHDDMPRVHKFSMDLYFESAGMILSLVLLGKYLELKAKRRTSKAIEHLIDLTPKTAVVIRGGAQLDLPIESLVVGDIVVVKPGGQIPVDGNVLVGLTAVDESVVTGESIPVEKRVGDELVSGTMNLNGYIEFRASRVGADTTLSRIIELVKEASLSKAPISRISDRISSLFVPVVMMISVVAVIVWILLGASVEFALSIGIAVLVISCPCALGLATPTAIMVGMGKGASMGILISSAAALEQVHAVQTVVLDKTGTITEGLPAVTDVHVASTWTEAEVLQVAGSLEEKSGHPLSQAVLEEVSKRSLPLLAVEQFESIPGKGISGWIGDSLVIVGNNLMMKEHTIDISMEQSTWEDFALEGKTPLFVGRDGVIIGIVAVADPVKHHAEEAVSRLKSMGLQVVMLTGDNEQTAMAVARSVGIVEVVSGVLPEGKEEVVRNLQDRGRRVAMVGDGINDAPALTRADVGIAVGAGSDIAIESADIVLVKSDLLDVVAAIRLGKAVMRTINQNLFWALFYNVLGIPLAAGLLYMVSGMKLNPMFAAAAMSMSSVFVVTNALRLHRFRPFPSKRSIKESAMVRKQIEITGMSCMHCVKRVSEALNAIQGVDASVDLKSGKAMVELSNPHIPDSLLIRAVSGAGYSVAKITEV